MVVAMSGGVDSSVAARLLKKQGFDLIGIFLKLWKDPKIDSGLENLCCSLEALTAARAVAAKLKIPFYVFDFSSQFKKIVVNYHISEYEAGRTPNPCIICNRDIRFGFLFQKAKELGAEYLATGHYVRLCQTKTNKTNLKLLTAKDKTKDQSYFLWTLSQEKLGNLLFPIGEYTKKEVRKMAKKWKLPTATRPESQGICFIPDRDLIGFLARYAKKGTRRGEIVDKKGRVLGKHLGLAFYTIGQRKGLGIKPHRPDQPPMYLIGKDLEKNQIIVGQEKDLYKKSLICQNVNWIDKYKGLSKRFKCQARIRYGHPPISSELKTQNSKLRVTFKKPVRAITPGQSVVFYSSWAARDKGEEVLGGGIIQ